MTLPHRSAPARPRSQPGLAIVLVAAVVAVVGAGCSVVAGPSPRPASIPAPSATAAPPGPLVSVQLRGGLCVGGTCDSTVTLDTDGRVYAATKPPNDLGTVSMVDVEGMAGVIEATDFAAIRAKPFAGTCPVAFDGQEVVYEFTTSHGLERIESCTTEVDPNHPLFRAVAGVLDGFVALPAPPGP